MITIDLEKCSKCGVCLKRFEKYCIQEKDGRPVIDSVLCNACQKCVAICPRQAILVNGTAPRKIGAAKKIDADAFEEFLAARRSIKKFKAAPIPRRLLERIAGAAAYGPNQNKNIALTVIDDAGLIRFCDIQAMRITGLWHRLLCTPNPIAWLARLFLGKAMYSQLRKKMDYGRFVHGHVFYEHTQALILAHGNPRVPVTRESAPYLFASMMYLAEALGVGTCLMDSLKLTVNFSPALRRRLGIGRGQKVFGVMALGFSDEKILNIPQGYSVPVSWNGSNRAVR